ncbi:hypothetical protein PAMC26510_12870 [Caballeronia sordidicola]|uniref:Uncharacterized protein n=1 Tax=Caballeronia sordidicola TaxID=196367 RepID=A0A242MXL7_CABSO|nr:hypothetical protein PAMC26510_12870 [Caballeronia sordidicola]
MKRVCTGAATNIGAEVIVCRNEITQVDLDNARAVDKA